jgi:hypothetical protein
MATNGEDRIGRIERLVQQDAENIHELAKIAQAHQAAIETLHGSVQELRETVAQVVLEWQAYLRRQPRQ